MRKQGVGGSLKRGTGGLETDADMRKSQKQDAVQMGREISKKKLMDYKAGQEVWLEEKRNKRMDMFFAGNTERDEGVIDDAAALGDVDVLGDVAVPPNDVVLGCGMAEQASEEQGGNEQGMNKDDLKEEVDLLDLL